MSSDGDFDIEQPGVLVTYLREQGLIGPEESPQTVILAGGVSNRAVLVERPGGEEWVVKQALAKLRVAVDWFSSPERIHRQPDRSLRSSSRTASSICSAWRPFPNRTRTGKPCCCAANSIPTTSASSRRCSAGFTPAAMNA
jgi:hypothetical protein